MGAFVEIQLNSFQQGLSAKVVSLVKALNWGRRMDERNMALRAAFVFVFCCCYFCWLSSIVFLLLLLLLFLFLLLLLLLLFCICYWLLSNLPLSLLFFFCLFRFFVDSFKFSRCKWYVRKPSVRVAKCIRIRQRNHWKQTTSELTILHSVQKVLKAKQLLSNQNFHKVYNSLQ